jgi:hypothetical protein
MGAYGSPELHPAITGSGGTDAAGDGSRGTSGTPTGTPQGSVNQWPAVPPPPPDAYAVPPNPYPPQPYPPQGYGAAPYAYPPYGAGSPYAASPPSNGVAVAAFVLGVIAMVLAWIPLFDIVLAAPAVILGGLGISRANRTRGTGKGLAIAGLILGAISILVTLVVFAILVAVSKPTR